jgi:hypothetical protein
MVHNWKGCQHFIVLALLWIHCYVPLCNTIFHKELYEHSRYFVAFGKTT